MKNYNLRYLYLTLGEFSRNSKHFKKSKYKPDVNDKVFIRCDAVRDGAIVHIFVKRDNEVIAKIRYGYLLNLMEDLKDFEITLNGDEVKDAIFTATGWVKRSEFHEIKRVFDKLEKPISSEMFGSQNVPTRSLVHNAIYLMDSGKVVLHRVNDKKERVLNELSLNYQGEFEVVSEFSIKKTSDKIKAEYPNPKIGKSVELFMESEMESRYWLEDSCFYDLRNINYENYGDLDADISRGENVLSDNIYSL